jgi:hypothetical protein
MNLLVDESVELEVVARLRADGHATVYVAELSPRITDDQVLDEANARSALLVTADKDFGELVYRPAASTPGSSSPVWRDCRPRRRRTPSLSCSATIRPSWPGPSA